MSNYKPIPDLTPAQLKRFFKLVKHDPETGCVVWTGHVNRQGYGLKKIGKRDQYLAHRVFLALCNNPVPVDKQVNHTCKHHGKRCLSHVEICDRSHNIRYARDHEGGIGRQKITRRVAQEIKRRSANKQSPRSIAKELGVSINTVYRIRSGENWRDLKAGPIHRLHAKPGQGKSRIKKSKSGRYEAGLLVHNTYHHVGTFDTKDEAVTAVWSKRGELGLCGKPEFGGC